MKLSAIIANSLWVASSLPAWCGFRRALDHPSEAQRNWLWEHLERNANCEFARKHQLACVRSYEEFARRVPLTDYDGLEPCIERIRSGEPRVLTNGPVTHLIPTSGSTGARKLIPFTAGSQRDFDCAIAPWICDLARQYPDILGGPAYWSISPAIQNQPGSSKVPIGFADDASYLGGVKGWLVRAALVTPSEPLLANDLSAFHQATLNALLCERELRLISVWHPSFLTLLLDTLPINWDALLADITRKNPHRARELERANPLQPETLWPRLRVISCWGDAHAEFGFAELRRRFPRTHIQRKGLLATEAFVTIPFAGEDPLAVCSHFFEFQDTAGRIRCIHELRTGETYNVIVTTSGGLWRYQLGDQAQVTGFVERTPSLRFIGRNGNVSDLRGEKLSEAFVAGAIAGACRASRELSFAMLAPEQDGGRCHYTLFIEGNLDSELTLARLEQALRANPHYALCRDLGQLQPLRLFRIRADAQQVFLLREAAHRQLGGIKPTSLSKRSDWAEHFIGSHYPAEKGYSPELENQNNLEPARAQ